MLDLNNISNITKEQFEQLNSEEKKLVLTILEELSKYGKSETLDDLWYQDYNEIPFSHFDKLVILKPILDHLVLLLHLKRPFAVEVVKELR